MAEPLELSSEPLGTLSLFLVLSLSFSSPSLWGVGGGQTLIHETPPGLSLIGTCLSAAHCRPCAPVHPGRGCEILLVLSGVNDLTSARASQS